MTPFIEVLFIVAYAAILASVAPYVLGKSEEYGSLIPGALAMATGAIVWTVLLWAGIPDTNGWIWALVMIAMPLGMGFGSKEFAKRRIAGKI
jgi:hypothetical protein